MKQFGKAVALITFVWAGLAIFKSITKKLEEDDLVRHGSGESDYQRSHPNTPKRK